MKQHHHQQQEEENVKNTQVNAGTIAVDLAMCVLFSLVGLLIGTCVNSIVRELVNHGRGTGACKREIDSATLFWVIVFTCLVTYGMYLILPSPWALQMPGVMFGTFYFTALIDLTEAIENLVTFIQHSGSRDTCGII